MPELPAQKAGSFFVPGERKKPQFVIPEPQSGIRSSEVRVFAAGFVVTRGVRQAGALRWFRARRGLPPR